MRDKQGRDAGYSDFPGNAEKRGWSCVDRCVSTVAAGNRPAPVFTAYLDCVGEWASWQKVQAFEPV